MFHVIRFTAFLSFTFSAVFSTGCGDSSGYSGQTYDMERPLVYPETSKVRPKILAFGDSLTAGFGLAETESYPYLLQEKLRAEGFDYEVLNAGVSGDTTLGGLERIDWALEQDNLEVVILELGANDLMRGIPVKRIEANLDQMLVKAKAKNVKVLLCGMFAPPNAGVDYQKEFMSIFPDLATKHNVAYLPFLLDGVALKRELNQADGIHPNAAGTKIMTENIFKELKPLLSKAAS
jgi:Lysophospholipase L1 and related esterases